MSPSELLRELEALTHAARMRRMVDLGRAAAGDAGIAATLSALEAGSFYERYLALQACSGSGDGAHVLRALDDPSRTIRGLAIRLVPIVCNDSQAEAALSAAPYATRRVLIRRLAKRHRRAPIDRLLASLASRGDERLAAAVRFGSAQVAARWIEPAMERGDQHDWRSLARRHPELAAAALCRRAETAERPDPRLLWQANAVLPVLAETAPGEGLQLVGALARHFSLAQLDLRRLTERRPVEMADLVLASEDRAGVTFSRVARQLDVEPLLAVAEWQADKIHQQPDWFHRLTPEQRAAMYDAGALGWRDRDGCLAPELVALLRRDQREQEARRHLALPALATRPLFRLPYAAFLPWEEAMATLDPFIRNPDAELRAAALAALIAAVRYQRGRLADPLGTVHARGNEQDPVRGAMLGGLAGLPPGIWRAEHLERLGAIIRQALDAPDLSAATAGAAERLIVSLLPFHAGWSAAWLATLVRERGQIGLYGLERRLSDADVRRIAPELLPVLRSWETREREGQLLAAAQSLGRRLRVFDGLVDLLVRVLEESRSHWTADRALRLIRQYRRDRLAALVPALIREDPSWITRDTVSGYLHHRRQDLLTPFLGQTAYRGRFSTGKTRFVLPVSSGFHRWTPAQQAIFAQTLGEIIDDQERDSPAGLTAIRRLAMLPAVAPARLIGLASLRNPRPALRDAALQALGRLDAGQGVPTLLEALNDPRARVAIYALRRSLLEMPVRRAVALLREVPLEKVTVAKEVVRLLGELTDQEAYRELLALDKRDLHRDVRIALLRAFWAHLEQPEPWQVFQRAAASPDGAIARSVGRIPADRLSPAAQQRLIALLVTLLGHPEPMVRVDVLRRCTQLPVSDPERALLPRLLTSLDWPLPDEHSAAAAALFATYSGIDAPEIGAAIEPLLPHRRALQTVVQALQSALHGRRGHLLPVARAVLAALARDPLTLNLRVELAISALPGDELGQLFVRLAGQELHEEALMLAVHTVERARSRREVVFPERLEAALARHADPRLRRLALAALVAMAGDSRGWDEERLSRLRAYRADPSPLVAAAAQFTLLPGEDAP